MWGKEAGALGLDGRGGCDSASPATSEVPAPLDELGCYRTVRQYLWVLVQMPGLEPVSRTDSKSNREVGV